MDDSKLIPGIYPGYADNDPHVEAEVEKLPAYVAIFVFNQEDDLILPFESLEQFEIALKDIAQDPFPIIRCMEKAPTLIVRSRLIAVTPHTYAEWDKAQRENRDLA